MGKRGSLYGEEGVSIWGRGGSYMGKRGLLYGEEGNKDGLFAVYYILCWIPLLQFSPLILTRIV